MFEFPNGSYAVRTHDNGAWNLKIGPGKHAGIWGYWSAFNDGVRLHTSEQPSWLQRKAFKLLLGWDWIRN